MCLLRHAGRSSDDRRTISDFVCLPLVGFRSTTPSRRRLPIIARPRSTSSSVSADPLDEWRWTTTDGRRRRSTSDHRRRRLTSPHSFPRVNQIDTAQTRGRINVFRSHRARHTLPVNRAREHGCRGAYRAPVHTESIARQCFLWTRPVDTGCVYPKKEPQLSESVQRHNNFGCVGSISAVTSC